MPPSRLRTAAPAQDLLRWYDVHGRDLPWRKKGGAKADPYHVWLSEIMLQQTTVAAVIPYFHKFLRRWPSVTTLAAAGLDEVLTAWAGLGYYARARNLHKCAQAVAALPGARFPHSEEELRELPGIGAYTAAAIAAIAYNRHAAVVDGNIERVIARLRRIETPLPAAKPEIAAIVADLTPHDRPGDFAQAMMDLGATVCTPRNPECLICPWAAECEARKAGVQTDLPRKAAKAPKPVRRGTAFVLFSKDQKILLRRRPEKGLLGGMYEPPGTEWGAAYGRVQDAPVQAHFKSGGEVRHIFTHFELNLKVEVAFDIPEPAIEGVWASLDELETFALPNLMRKVIDRALKIEPPARRARERG